MAPPLSTLGIEMIGSNEHSLKKHFFVGWMDKSIYINQEK